MGFTPVSFSPTVMKLILQQDDFIKKIINAHEPLLCHFDSKTKKPNVHVEISGISTKKEINGGF